MEKLPLVFRKDHLFVRYGKGLLLMDTGSPQSFGSLPSLTIAGKQFGNLPGDFPGVNVEELSRFIGIKMAGLLGTDVMNQFDVLIDIPDGTVTFSESEIKFKGRKIPIEGLVMGVPIITVKIKGKPFRMFFDTGASIAYLNGDIPDGFQYLGQVRDFYPTDGWFMAEVFNLDFLVGKNPYRVRCGLLPEKAEKLRRGLEIMGVAGLIGIDLFKGRPIGYFPKRKLILL